MIKENDRVQTLVESEGYKAGLIGVVIFVSPDGKYCDVELWGGRWLSYRSCRLRDW